MYATDTYTPHTITVPAPTTDNPAAGTTGVPAGAGAGAGRRASGKFSVPAGVAMWAIGGLAVIVGTRAVFRNGGLA